MIDFEDIKGFDWDEGNVAKNWRAHRVMATEVEQVFFNKPLIIAEDEKHSSEKERRYFALGRTDGERLLFVVFTLRKRLIRIISARDMSKKGRRLYEKAQSDSKV